MPLPDGESLDSLAKGGAVLERLAELDAAGLLLAPAETLDAYCERLRKISSSVAELSKASESPEGFPLFPGVSLFAADRMPPEVLAEAEAETRRLYDFSIDWVPGFFISKGVGPLWGGCALSFQDGSGSVFLTRSAFAARRRWFIYDRDELVAHELCHVARAPLADRPLEEHFAYQTSKSALRRHVGNCFQTQLDALAFVIPVFILLGVQSCSTFLDLSLPVWPFWLFALGVPASLLVRNELQRRVAAKALKALAEAGCAKPEAVLFRSSSEEARRFASLLGRPGELVAALDKLAAEELRWAVIKFRFFNGKDSSK